MERARATEAVARAKAAAGEQLAAAAGNREELAALVRLCASLTDLTSLGDGDTGAAVEALCERALGGGSEGLGRAAAVCVHSPFVETARRTLEAGRAGRPPPLVATVVNFPDGSPDAGRAAREASEAVSRGADEIDVVWPYRRFLEGFSEPGGAAAAAREQCKLLVAACVERARAAAGRKVAVKVIIESGELRVVPGTVADSARAAVEAGADFVKTSTGKVPVGATLEDAYEMLTAISGTSAGFKASGGIRTAEDALAYVHLAREIMGPDFVCPEKFRFGASAAFWDNLLKTLEGGGANAHPTAAAFAAADTAGDRAVY
ncbi:MAG: deoxyribose-phosphate aldolase [Olpidium bornovanus]|uniref:deoxyribose-phosphate aldolase n=1 Tax=Olpidium bornovanus TaxID=278681 RepID=A0A8H8DLX3_9FUNG|nr:MAG: deoxyribose-phosphate aldolase [Olpidium bornovanus]